MNYFQLHRRGLGIVSRLFAVVKNKTSDKSNGSSK
jgi:hypothetical protein